MSDYKLYCFGDSGHSYKVALMLELAGLEWQPVKVDFFNGETRGDDYRNNVNQMGEAPVLITDDENMTQSGVILNYLADKHGKFGGNTEAEKREIWRWILFDNHKASAQLGLYRFLTAIKKMDKSETTDFIQGRYIAALKIMEKHLVGRDYFVANRPTIADFSLCAYFYYAKEYDLDLKPFPNITGWLENIRALKGWQHPYDLMPDAKL